MMNRPAAEALERRRKRNWIGKYEKLLINLWEKHIEEFRSNRKNTLIYPGMARVITKAGFPVNALDVKIKIDNLTKKYRDEFHKEAICPGNGSTWEHYTRIHHILSDSKPFNLSKFVVQSTDLSPVFRNKKTSIKKKPQFQFIPEIREPETNCDDPLSIDETNIKIEDMATDRTKAIISMAKDTRDFHRQMLELVKKNIKREKDK